MFQKCLRLIQLAGIPRLEGRGILVVAFLIDALGTGLYQPFSLLFFQNVTQLDLPAIGSALTIATIVTLPLNPLTGSLVDRFGARRLVVASQLLQALGFVGYLVVSDIPQLFAASLLVTAGNRVFFASAFPITGFIDDEHSRTRWCGAGIAA